MSTQKRNLAQMPWLALFAMCFTLMLGQILAYGFLVGVFKQPLGQWSTDVLASTLMNIVVLFILIPFVYKLPEGKRSFRAYLTAIRLSRIQPFWKLLILTLTCYLILACCQAAGVVVYRASLGLPVNWTFIQRYIDPAIELPPRSPSWLISFPSIFEEITFRGVVLSVFLRKYSKSKAILFSALAFGMLHITNYLFGDRELVWVLGQILWAFQFGLFYGYITIKTNSLWPAMLVHYLSNMFVFALTNYLQSTASMATQAIYGITFTFGIIPTVLMIVWVHLFTKNWTVEGPKVSAPI